MMTDAFVSEAYIPSAPNNISPPTSDNDSTEVTPNQNTPQLISTGSNEYPYIINPDAQHCLLHNLTRSP